MKFKTVYSVYELDLEGKRMRRLEGENDPTPRQGPDGEWKTYHSSGPHDPMGYLIDWDGEGHCTLTSGVVAELG